LKLLVANRNFTKAEELGNRFNGSAIDLHALESGEAPSILQNATISVIISTLPAAVNFTLPKSLLPVTAMTPTEPMPIVFDVVYIPALTPLLLQAKDMGCAVIQGATMLLQQGIEQFQLWHERQAPGFTMRQAIFRKQLPVSDHPTNEEEERRVPNIDSVLDY
jgi:shikimate 5-dehydrogenase